MLPFLLYAQNNNAPSSYDPHEIAITGYLQHNFKRHSRQESPLFLVAIFLQIPIIDLW